jgi:hypothetical protein
MAGPSVKALLEQAKKAGARIYSPRIIIPKGGFLSLETVLTHEDMFGLTTATPVQRAICRAIDGLPLEELWEHEEVRKAFGNVLPKGVQKLVLILSAIRGGKSKIAAARLVQSSQNVDLSHVSIGDKVLSPCLSVDRDMAAMVFNHAIETIRDKPALRALLIGEPQAESFTLRHPTGRPIQVRVSAVAKHGSTLVGAWLAGLTLDEAPRMASAEDGVRNMEDSIAATRGRILPGATTLLIGSPWQPFGYAYELYTKNWGIENASCLVVCAPGPAMNPTYWTPEKCEEIRLEDPAAYEANVNAKFTDQQSSMFSAEIIDKRTRVEPVELVANDLHTYVAAMDPATRSNHWSFVIATRGPCDDGKIRDRIVLRRIWKRTNKENLDATTIFREMRPLLDKYRIKFVRTDQWAPDILAALAREYGITILDETETATTKAQSYERLRLRLAEDQVELPPDARLREELLRVRKNVTRTGYSIESPILADGSHGDLVSAVVRVLNNPIPEPLTPPKILSPLEYDLQQMQNDRKKAIADVAKNNQKRLKKGQF